MEHEGLCDTNCNWWVWNDPQRLSKVAGGFRNQKIS